MLPVYGCGGVAFHHFGSGMNFDNIDFDVNMSASAPLCGA
jgi:hypothetical protein